jgi:hypothetical protein
MTGENYLEFLQNGLPEQLEDVPLATRIAMYLQHDGAPPHYTRLVMHHPNDAFPNRWISRGSTINWPPRSPALTPLDLYGVGWRVKCTEEKWTLTWDELLDHIMDAIAHIKECRDELRRATRHVLT